MTPRLRALLVASRGGALAIAARPLAPLLVALSLSSSCGEAGRPRAGSMEICSQVVSGALNCPATGFPSTPVPADACARLVSCGILAAEQLVPDGRACDNCASGVCAEDSKGNKVCQQHSLDYQWCVRRLGLDRSTTDPCDQRHSYSAEEIATAERCIERTPCAALGLLLVDKLKSRDKRPLMDRYSCNDGRQVFTATVCDNGILNY